MADFADSPTFKNGVQVVNGTVTDDLRVSSPTVPSGAGDSGTAGDIAWDSGYIYVCTATDTWVRAALTTWT